MSRLLIIATALVPSSAALVPYSGLTPTSGTLSDATKAMAVPKIDGLVLEVADSLVAENAGRGLFIRCLPGVDEVAVDGGTALCGYGGGEMCATRPERAAGRYTQFKLIGCAPVWFEGNLESACALLQRDDIDSIVGHEAVRDASGLLKTIRADDTYSGTHQFFVPSEDAVTGAELSVSSCGIMANDLAALAPTSAEYDASSAEKNLLVLVQELARDPADASVLVPTRPVPTVARGTTFTNSAPMEIGISYGSDFWQGK